MTRPLPFLMCVAVAVFFAAALSGSLPAQILTPAVALLGCRALEKY